MKLLKSYFVKDTVAPYFENLTRNINPTNLKVTVTAKPALCLWNALGDTIKRYHYEIWTLIGWWYHELNNTWALIGRALLWKVDVCFERGCIISVISSISITHAHI